MKYLLVAAIAAGSAVGANATVVAAVAANQNPSSFITLSAADVTGGALYTGNALPAAAIPMNTATSQNTVGTWLAVGPPNTNNGGGAATVTFSAPMSFTSFLWGSPDSFNVLTLTTNVTSYTYTGASFPGFVITGNQDYASYIGFTATNGELIKSLTFSNTTPTADAFEASNFSVTAPVPEPETYALMLAGLGVIGFIARRRKAD